MARCILMPVTVTVTVRRARCSVGILMPVTVTVTVTVRRSRCSVGILTTVPVPVPVPVPVSVAVTATAAVNVVRMARTVAEDGEAVQRGHLDDEGEEVVDDSVEELVRHLPPRHVRHALQPVVDVQLRAHHDEPEGVHAPHQGPQHERVPKTTASPAPPPHPLRKP
eukprot:7936349-Pyramimonas_sp.AAC.1